MLGFFGSTRLKPKIYEPIFNMFVEKPMINGSNSSKCLVSSLLHINRHGGECISSLILDNHIGNQFKPTHDFLLDKISGLFLVNPDLPHFFLT